MQLQMKLFGFLIITFLSFILSGCANTFVPYYKTDPEGAAEEVKKHNGYYELKKAPEENAKIILRSVSGAGITTYFSKVKINSNCISLEKIGSAADGQRAIMSPNLKKFSEVLNIDLGSKPSEYLKIDVIPGEPITIHSIGRSLSSSNNGITITTTTAKCGPFIKQFTPQSRKSYLVEFQWDKGCRMNISDATDPDKPLLIDVPEQKEIAVCK
jgi:hypothetical protein